MRERHATSRWRPPARTQRDLWRLRNSLRGGQGVDTAGPWSPGASSPARIRTARAIAPACKPPRAVQGHARGSNRP